MATLVYGLSFDGGWLPDALAGGTIGTRSTTLMSYVSDMGYTVTMTGTDFTYDADGMPSGGNLSGLTVARGGLTFTTFIGMSVDQGRAGMFLLGYDRDNGYHQNPDPFGFFNGAMRGNDLVIGSGQWDDIRGGLGNDTINCGAGGDYVGDQQGNDSMDGGADWDTLSYDEANYSWEPFRGVALDALTGVALDPWGFTDSFKNFERFKDTSLADTLKGANVDEQFVINRGNDVVDGRGGYDDADYSEATRWGAHRGVIVNLATGVAKDSWGGTDSLTNIEAVRGTDFNDRLTGSSRDERFLGGAGIDVINMSTGYDRLEFWNVGDNNLPGHGIVIDLNATKIVVDDGYGNSETPLGVEEFGGSRFNDRMTGNIVSNRLYGNDGNDTINGGAGEDFLGGDWGNDVISGGVGNNDHIDGGGDNDTLTGNGGNDNFNFGWNLANAGVDTITDFDGTIDLIHIASWWGGGFVADVLVAGQFRAGADITTANTTTQRVIYNTTTGDLYFDADGAGGVAAVKFAILSNLASLTFDDIHLMF